MTTNEKIIEQLKESLKINQWLRGECEKCETRLKILHEETIKEEENYEEIETEDKLLSELLARAHFEHRNLLKLQSKIVNS
jgi:hypothetical protein